MCVTHRRPFFNQNAKLTLTNTVVEEGLAIFGGALYLEGSSSVNTYGGSIRSNVGEVSAGAALLVVGCLVVEGALRVREGCSRTNHC